MGYKYRWLYALIMIAFVSAVGFFYDLQPTLQRLAQLQVDAEQRAAELAVLTRIAQQHSLSMPQTNALVKADKQTDFLSDLLSLAQLNGLTTQSVDIKALQPPDGRGLEIQLTTQGDFLQVTAFVAALDQQNYPVLILDFSCQVGEDNHLIFVMNILRVATVAQSLALANEYNAVAAAHSPFCNAVNEHAAINPYSMAATQAIPLGLLKMAGYLQQDQIQQAILSLPSHDLVAVGLGDTLGKEQGIVIKILRDRVVIETPTKKQIILDLE